MKLKGKVKPGYGVASGKGGDLRFPEGTIRQQWPHFKKRGLDLSQYFPGTVNVDITPYTIRIKSPKHYFDKIDWSEHIPPENFYFFDVTVTHNRADYQGLIYLPDPSTKSEHFQGASVLELLLPKIEGLKYDASIEISVKEDQISMEI